MFDIGIFLGGWACGYLTDKIGNKRAILMLPMALVSCAFIGVIKLFGGEAGAAFFYIFILLYGLFLGGPYNIL